LPTTEPESARFQETASTLALSAERSGPSLDVEPETATKIAVRDWAATAAKDEVLVAPEDTVAGSRTPDSGEVFVMPESRARDEADPRATELVEPGYAVDNQLESPDSVQSEPRVYVSEAREETDVIQEAVAADTGDCEGEVHGNAVPDDNGDSDTVD